MLLRRLININIRNHIISKAFYKSFSTNEGRMLRKNVQYLINANWFEKVSETFFYFK